MLDRGHVLDGLCTFQMDSDVHSIQPCVRRSMTGASQQLGWLKDPAVRGPGVKCRYIPAALHCASWANRDTVSATDKLRQRAVKERGLDYAQNMLTIMTRLAKNDHVYIYQHWSAVGQYVFPL